MEFALTEEQLMIRDTATAFLAEVSTSESIRAAMATALGYDDRLWNQICQDLVWPALHIPEQYGGMGLGYVELVAMLEQMGSYLLCSPFFSSVCLGANALLVAGNEEQKALWLPQIAQGMTATLAFVGPQAGSYGGVWDQSAIAVKAEPATNGYCLNGEYRYVIDGASAQLLILVAQTQNNEVMMFVVPGDTPGITRAILPTMDQTRKQATIQLQNVIVPEHGVMKGAASELEMVLQLATVALAAEQMGGAQQCLDMAVAYTKERVQFGKSIASFQAIKHKAADMMMRVEVARSGVYYAACIAQEAFESINQRTVSQFALELPEAASIAKSYCSETYFKNAAECMQMHGGVGFTWEYDVHLHFKRAKASEHYLGNAAYHREKLAELLLDREAAQ